MDTNVKKQEDKERKPKTVKSVFNVMLLMYVEQMKRETFYSDGTCMKIYEFVKKSISKEIEENPSKESEYNKILEMAKRFYDIALDSDVREKVIEAVMNMEDFMKAYGNDILGEDKRSFDRSHNYIKGLISLEDKTIVSTEREDSVFKAIKSINMDRGIPYTEIESIFERARQDMQNRKLEEQARKPKKEVIVKKALDLKEKDEEVFVFDYNGGKIVVQEVGKLEYAVGNESGNIVRRYRVRKEMEGKEPSEEYVFSNIDLYEMEESMEYCEAVLGELLSDNNIGKSNAGGYIGELRDNLGELRRMKIGDEIDDGDYIYKTPHKSKRGRFYGHLFDAQDLSAVVEWEKQQEREKDQEEQQPKDTSIKEEKTDDELEI